MPYSATDARTSDIHILGRRMISTQTFQAINTQTIKFIRRDARAEESLFLESLGFQTIKPCRHGLFNPFANQCDIQCQISQT